MDRKTEMQVRNGYASLFDASTADSIQSELFPDLDETADFDLATEHEAAEDHLSNSHRVRGEAGVRLRNYDEAPTEAKKNIAQAIKGFWESRSFMPDDPDTIIIVSGTDSIATYEPSLRGRIYNMK